MPRFPARLRTPRARLDITYGVPELQAVQQAVREQDRRSLSLLVRGCADDDDRSDRVFVAASTAVESANPSVPPQWIADWVAQEPRDATASAVAGAAEVLRAWRVRGYARARRTEGSALRSFRRILGDAEGICRQAAEAAPDDPIPWVWLVQMARGQEVGLEETVRRWNRLTALAPQHLRGHHQMLISISPKWGYPGRVMDEFVESVAETAPDGSALHLLPVAAQVEHWLNLPDEPSVAYIMDQARGARGRAAIARWLHPRRTDPRGVISGHNLAAFWHCLRGRLTEAGPHFEQTRGYCDHFPWGYLGEDPLKAYTERRRKAR